MASFSFTPHPLVRTPPMLAAPAPAPLAPDAPSAGTTPQDVSPPAGLSLPPPVETLISAQASQTAVFANARLPDDAAQSVPDPSRAQPVQFQPVDAQPDSWSQRLDSLRRDGIVPDAPQAVGYADRLFDFSVLPDHAPIPPLPVQPVGAADAYDKSRGLFGAPNQTFGKF